MLRMRLVIVLSCVAAVALAGPDGQADPVAARLGAARKVHEAELTRLRETFLRAIADKETTAQKGGELELLNKIRAERAAFEASGDLPTAVPSTKYADGVNEARGKLEQAFVNAIRDYTKAGATEQAEAVMRELGVFRTVGRPRTAPAFFRSALSAQVLAAKGGAKVDGTLLIQWTKGSAESKEQQWRIAPAADGWSTIENVNSGACLSVPAGNSGAGTPVTLSARRQGDAAAGQLWRVVPSDKLRGHVMIISRDGKHAATISEASRKAGAQIILWKAFGGQEQLWRTEEIK